MMMVFKFTKIQRKSFSWEISIEKVFFFNEDFDVQSSYHFLRMCVFLVWILCLFDFRSNQLLKKQEEVHSQVFTKWINHFLNSIQKLDDLYDGQNFSILTEVLSGERINDDLDLKMNEKERKINSFKNCIQILKSKKIDIPDVDIKSMIQKRKANDMSKIVWNIISNLTIDNNYFNGYKGESGLLKWVNQFTDKTYLNFTGTWRNGTTIINILNQFYPNDINISKLTNANNNTEYFISCLQKVGAPIYIDNESIINYLDEKIIIIQYASLFHHLSWPQKPNTNEIKNNNNLYYFHANYLYSQIGLPDFNEDIIPQNKMHRYITYNNQINQQINEHFKINMHSRYPRQIAFIKEDGDKLNVEYNIDMFEHVVSRSGSRPIIFVSCLGRYQQGKSTINSGITGNYGYVIGNGSKETTKGVYIDGPYDINYLYQRFNISIREDMYFEGNEILSPLIYFFDIEGYDGSMHGSDLEKNNKAFIEMCTPFLCLSSIFILVSEPNANVVEITNFFERVKVSKLTTYSNKDDSNGALQLNIVFNRYNSIYKNSKNNKKCDIKKSIKDFQKQMQKQWIGVQALNKYGINHDFYPILEGLDYFCENDMFYDVFKYFVENIIRSIENAAEGKFVRSAAQSINLFHYIIEHFNDQSFEEMIKLLIRSEHEKSFETFSIKSFNETLKKINPMINEEFDQYCKRFNFDIDIANIKKRYEQIGDQHIKKDLKVIQDHDQVSIYIEKLRLEISNIIDQKHNDLIKYKDKLINEFNNKIEQKADELSSEILNKMFAKLDEEKNFDFNQEKIQNLIKEQINIYRNELIRFKKDENLFLLPNKKISLIVSEKQKYFNDVITKHINNEILFVAQLKEENDLKLKIIQAAQNKINDDYWYYEGIVMDQLAGNLTDKSFYVDNYKKIYEVILKSQKLIYEYILSKKSEHINNICNDLIQKNESNSQIIERLKKKNRYIINDDIIDLIVDSNKYSLSLKVQQAFNKAYMQLTEFIKEERKIKVSWRYRQIEIKKTYIYPDGKIKEGPWEYVRTEKIPFWQAVRETSFGDIIEFIVFPAIKLNEYLPIGR